MDDNHERITLWTAPCARHKPQNGGLSEPLIGKQTVIDIPSDCSELTDCPERVSWNSKAVWDVVCTIAVGSLVVVTSTSSKCLLSHLVPRQSCCDYHIPHPKYSHLPITAKVAASVTAIIKLTDVFVCVAGGICIVNALSILPRQHIILNSSSLENKTNQLRKQAKQLQETNDFVVKSMEVLNEAVDKWRSSEVRLRSIARRQSTHVNEIIALVKENQSLLTEIKTSLQKNLAMDITKSIMEAGKRKIDREEAPLVALRLKIHFEKHGIYLDHGEILTMLEDDNDIMTILKFCNQILEGYEPDILVRDNVAEGELSFVQFSERLEDICGSEKPPQGGVGISRIMEKAFHGTISYSSGSADVARGRRVSVYRRRLLDEAEWRLSNSLNN